MNQTVAPLLATKSGAYLGGFGSLSPPPPVIKGVPKKKEKRKGKERERERKEEKRGKEGEKKEKRKERRDKKNKKNQHDERGTMQFQVQAGAPGKKTSGAPN